MKLITKPEELVVGERYWFQSRNNPSRIFQIEYARNFGDAATLACYHIIQLSSPTEEDFAKLVEEHLA